PEAFYATHAQDILSALGILTSGGTAANLTSLWCARNLALGRDGDFPGVESEGLPRALAHYGAADAVIVGSQLLHYSFKKAAGILGLGERNLLTVPAGRDNRIDLAALRTQLELCRERGPRVVARVGIAGTTETGSVDPLAAMADLAAEAQVHFHVDAAWGGPTLFSARNRHLLRGIERADTVTIDGHKQLYLPMGIGMLLFRDPHAAAAIEKQARYTLRAGSGDLGKRSLEGSRPAMVLYLHAALHLIGRRGYEALIDEGIRKARAMADAIRRRPEFELLAEPELNLLVYRYIPEGLRDRARDGTLDEAANRTINELNDALQRTQGRAGQSFVSRTALETTRYGRSVPIVALRVVLANPLTTDDDILAVLDEQVARAPALERSGEKE
ncbi:MAG TPA: pyridoxal-dependent decarboxylase, partial [Thermoanaerobaculia bacterium]